MSSLDISPLALKAEIESWPLVAPFHISGHTWNALDVLKITVGRGGHVGCGEAAGVYYKDETPASMLREIESVRGEIESGVSCNAVQKLLGASGARNALDCALWDLHAKVTGVPVWKLANLERPRPILTTFTCGADLPEKMAATACGFTQAKAIKIKLMGDSLDAERVRAVRAARADAWLGVDANQALTRQSLERLMPVLIEVGVQLIEQPFRVGDEAHLTGLCSPIPLAADESVQTLADVDSVAGCFQVVNIKLDKCGGLTEALAMARLARQLGLKAMVGNMMGTSLAMAPAFVVGQLCDIVDLDGPVYLKFDREPKVSYEGGLLSCPEALWG